jgi:hypothetical protein
VQSGCGTELPGSSGFGPIIQGQPQLPLFLGLLHVADMRQPDPDPFRRLVGGITGEKSPAEL